MATYRKMLSWFHNDDDDDDDCGGGGDDHDNLERACVRPFPPSSRLGSFVCQEHSRPSNIHQKHAQFHIHPRRARLTPPAATQETCVRIVGSSDSKEARGQTSCYSAQEGRRPPASRKLLKPRRRRRRPSTSCSPRTAWTRWTICCSPTWSAELDAVDKFKVGKAAKRGNVAATRAAVATLLGR